MPFLVALWCHEHGNLRDLSLTNQGHLLKKTVRIAEWRHLKKWRLVYVAQASCDASCLHALMTLARVRLALGRHLYGIELWLLIPPSALDNATDLARQLHEMDVHVSALSVLPDALRHSPIWIVNNKGEGVLTYPDVTHPQAVFSDLKRLSPLWES